MGVQTQEFTGNAYKLDLASLNNTNKSEQVLEQSESRGTSKSKSKSNLK